MVMTIDSRNKGFWREKKAKNKNKNADTKEKAFGKQIWP